MGRTHARRPRLEIMTYSNRWPKSKKAAVKAKAVWERPDDILPGNCYLVRVSWETEYELDGGKLRHTSDSNPMTHALALRFAETLAGKPQEAGAKITIVRL